MSESRIIHDLPCLILRLFIFFTFGLFLLEGNISAEKVAKKDYRNDCILCLEDETENLEKQLLIEGLNQEALSYIRKRIENVKKRIAFAPEDVSKHSKHLQMRQAQKVEFFGTEATGRKFVFVIDKSGSMLGKRLLAAKSELMRSISTFNEETQFYVLFYDTKSVGLPGDKLIAATDENRDMCRTWLKKIKAKGRTSVLFPMIRAIAMSPDGIFLLSDGLFDNSAARIIKSANLKSTNKITINTIAFMSNKGLDNLQRIARENNGQYRYIGPKKKKKRKLFAWWPFRSLKK